MNYETLIHNCLYIEDLGNAMGYDVKVIEKKKSFKPDVIVRWENKKAIFEEFLRICIKDGDQVKGQKEYIELILSIINNFLINLNSNT